MKEHAESCGNHRTAEAGYICIWGTAPKERVTDAEGVVMECPECKREARMIGKSVRTYCTIFYIPLFPEGSGQELFECSACGSKFQGSTDELRQRIAASERRLHDEIAQKVAHYAQNRDDLANAADLITLYASADRMNEAINLALECLQRHPGDASIRVLLGRLYLSQNRDADALAAFKTAVEQNPQHGGAHFYLALSLFQAGDPMSRDTALKHAQQADQLGHPDGRGLVQHIQKAG